MLVFLLLLLNFGISWCNAYVCGQSWIESKAIGGWIRLVVWCGAIMSALGFSSVFIAGIALGGVASGLLPLAVAEIAMSMWYLAVIIPVLGTGLIITIHSWQVAYRERDLLSIGTASYNTLAQAHNMVQAVDGIGSAIGTIAEGFESDDLPSAAMILAFLIAGVSILGGVLLTVVLIKKYAGTVPLPSPEPVFQTTGRARA